MSCPSCALLVINGIPCHEHGCPEAWRDKKFKCLECGAYAKPEELNQRFCSPACEEVYHQLEGF